MREKGPLYTFYLIANANLTQFLLDQIYFRIILVNLGFSQEKLSSFSSKPEAPLADTRDRSVSGH